MMKWNVYGGTEAGVVWEDELEEVGLSELEMCRIRELPLDRCYTDSSDASWFRVQ